MTPRRSTRLQKYREKTPEPPKYVVGPRALMILNKSKQKLEQTFEQTSSVKITIQPATPIANDQTKESVKKRGRPRRNTEDPIEKAQQNVVVSTTVQHIESKGEATSSNVTNLEEDKKAETNNDVIQEMESAIKEDDKKVDNDVKKEISKVNIEINADEKKEVNIDDKKAESIDEKVYDLHPSGDSKDQEAEISNKNGEVFKEEEEKHQDVVDDEKTLVNSNTQVEKMLQEEENVTKEIQNTLNHSPQLMDESIVMVLDSPAPEPSTIRPTKDSTFSPEVDTSITDSRPHIDSILDTTPIHKNVTLRTSTPLAQRLFKRDTPKLSMNVLSAFKKILSPKLVNNERINESTLNDTVNGQFKMKNPLEKSILKSSHRKRSLSVADAEMFAHKKVMFVSPEICEIDEIDQRMLQSFREEKEISIMKSAGKSGGRRKRSLSVTDTPSRFKPKMPNFKAIHEQQFKKMESIVDHAQRKVDRAKRLITPSKSLPIVAENEIMKLENATKQEVSKSRAASRIPTATDRKPLSKIPSIENIAQASKNRLLKRSQSVEVPEKKLKREISTTVDKKSNEENVKKVETPSRLVRAKSEVANSRPLIKFPTAQIFGTSSSSQPTRTKVEERREKNMSLFKTKTAPKILEQRKKSENMLKGVRLNRRFELQMQHRRGISDNAED